MEPRGLYLADFTQKKNPICIAKTFQASSTEDDSCETRTEKKKIRS